MSKFKKIAAIIQEIVKVEVKLQMKEMRKTLTEEIRRELQNTPTDVVSNEPPAQPTPSLVNMVAQDEINDFKFVNESVIDGEYSNGLNFQTGNPVLDEVLNSTRGGIPQTPGPMGTYPDMGGQAIFDTNSMGAIAAHAAGQPTAVPIPAAGHSGARLDTNTKEGATIAHNLTKDYSAVMKAIKEKSGR